MFFFNHLTQEGNKESSRLCVYMCNLGLLVGKLQEIVDTKIRCRVKILYVQKTKMEEVKGEEGGRYRFQALVHRHYDN
jgi:hypothetical protein